MLVSISEQRTHADSPNALLSIRCVPVPTCSWHPKGLIIHSREAWSHRSHTCEWLSPTVSRFSAVSSWGLEIVSHWNAWEKVSTEAVQGNCLCEMAVNASWIELEMCWIGDRLKCYSHITWTVFKDRTEIYIYGSCRRGKTRGCLHQLSEQAGQPCWGQVKICMSDQSRRWCVTSLPSASEHPTNQNENPIFSLVIVFVNSIKMCTLLCKILQNRPQQS